MNEKLLIREVNNKKMAKIKSQKFRRLIQLRVVQTRILSAKQNKKKTN